jgi:hypothetical protein
MGDNGSRFVDPKLEDLQAWQTKENGSKSMDPMLDNIHECWKHYKTRENNLSQLLPIPHITPSLYVIPLLPRLNYL